MDEVFITNFFDGIFACFGVCLFKDAEKFSKVRISKVCDTSACPSFSLKHFAD